MNIGLSGRLRRWSGRIRRFVTRHPVGAGLLCAVPVGVASLALVLGGSGPGGDAVMVGQIVVVLLSSALLIRAGFGVQRVVPPARRVFGRRAQPSLQPSNPPIEKIAADLRRMLWRHDRLARSTPVAMSSRQLRALEAAISTAAVQAARGLGVSHPDAPAFGGFDTAELRHLLRALTAEGLMLPPEVGLMAQNRF
jgi:hypothetical protein